jgi:energy-coupling factor transporter ATP-binding protein EcfA2
VTWLSCRPVRVGEVTVVITTSDAGIRDRFDQLLAAMPDPGHGSEPSRVADVRIGMVQPGGDERSDSLVELWLDGEREIPWADEGTCESRVLSWIDTWALDGEPERLHLHAGLVSSDGAGILIVGPKGAGKSTLVAHLARAGWVYHSDEMVGFDPDHPLVARALPRPPSLKSGSWPLFADLPTVRSRRQRRRAQDRLHIPPGELGSLPGSDRSEVRAIVFLSFGDAGECFGDAGELTPIAPSEAIERCVADTMDLGRSGVDGMRALVHLVTGTHQFRLGTYELTQAADLFSPLAELPPVETGSLDWELLPGDQGAGDLSAGDQGGGDEAQVVIGPETRLRRAPRVAAWSLADGAVVYDPSRETVTRLNPSGGEIWRQLNGRSAADLAAHLGFLAEGDAASTETILAVLRRLHGERLVEA